MAGFTKEQLTFISSNPAARWVHDFKGNAYIPGVITTKLLNTAFGPDGWSVEILSQSQENMSPIEVRGKQRWRSISTVVVRIRAYLRDERGRLTDRYAFRDGLSMHEGNCNAPHLLYGAMKNSLEGAYTRALRNAAILFGEVFGLFVMRMKDANRRALMNDETPPYPRLAAADSGDVGVHMSGDIDAGLIQSELDDYEERQERRSEPVSPQQVEQPRQQERPQQPAQDPPWDHMGNQPSGEKAYNDARERVQEKARELRDETPAQRETYEDQRNDEGELDTFEDGKSWIVRWKNPDGSFAVRFCTDPKVTEKAVVEGGATNVEHRPRRADDREDGEPRLRRTKGREQGTSQDDQRTLVRECRSVFRQLPPEIFHQACDARGFKAAQIASQKANVLSELLTFLKTKVKEYNR